MIAMPAGLIDGVNIVVYDSPSSLKKLIRHYLQPEHEEERKKIAIEGYKVAMGRHRCWHRLEELLFGRPLTNVDSSTLIPPIREKRPESMFWVAEEDALDQFV
jgi:hypothetical protein